MMFNNLEVQTNFLNRISNMENLEESTTMNPNDINLLKSVLILIYFFYFFSKKKKLIFFFRMSLKNNFFFSQKRSSIKGSLHSADSFNNQQISGLNFDSKKFVEEEFNKSKYLTITSTSPNPRRISILGSQFRSKFMKQSLNKSMKKWGSTFLSNLADYQDEDDFNNTLNNIVKKNVDYWQDFSKSKHEIEFKMLNQIIEKRQNLKKKFLGKLLMPEKKSNNNKKGYIDLMETMGSVSTSLQNSKLPSQFH